MKSNPEAKTESGERFAEVLSLLEKNLRYIESLGLSPSTGQDYRRVLGYLRARSPQEVDQIFGKGSSKKKPERAIEPDLTDEEVTRLKAEQIRRHVTSAKTTRVFLERLASIRFGVTKGALSTLRSREALNEKILTLLAHEGTHDAISRAATGQGDTPTDKPDKS